MTGVGFRACMFPLYVYQIRASQRLMQARSDFKKIWSAYKYARTFLPSSDQRGHLQAILIARRGANFVMDKYNTRPVQTMLGSLLNIPIFFLVAYSARDMIRSGNFEGLQTGGLWIWANMMEPDSTYVLPIVACASTYLNQEVSLRSHSVQRYHRYAVSSFHFCRDLMADSRVMQGVFFYWIGASWAMMGQSLLMDNNAVRRKLGLRPRISAPAKPATADVAAGSASVDKSAEVSVKDKHNA
ncbi:TPA: hypothetical protein N0F65_012478 [Lagenidium giganteum]|uniref:Membrane insertase YidC/Oxa/ALB C-terminal domain-containing protein n=1 Tax=Lagenidium giganteum TaxID=4803 RepID=A0AAV2YMY6_9STRA|nr:TPA: hypothetical protein N0F65_012478 [Lagenidium giganteum]